MTSNIKSWNLFSIALITFSMLLLSCSDENKEQNDTKGQVKLVTSTIKGGNWFDINTWEDNVIPNENCDVNITGKVFLKDSAKCLNLMIDMGATLEVNNTGYLFIKHHAVNEGMIINEGTIILNDN